LPRALSRVASSTHLWMAGDILIDGPLRNAVFLFVGRRVMTLTKADLAKSLMEKIRLKKPRKEEQQILFPELDYTALSKRRATNLVDALFEIIKKMLEKGEQVSISGFGRFQVKFKWARKGRNPQTGDPIILKSRRIVRFQYSPQLKEKINQKREQ
jgi:integration host factor subunit alpha